MIVAADQTGIAEAARILRTGGLVAFPTETVYGLGADATDARAVARIYAAKERPHFNPLIIHAAHATDFDNIVTWNETARELAAAFWPGPLTMILPRAMNCPVAQLAGAGLPTLAIRVPNHPIARTLLQKTARPIAAPSANLAGRISPTTPQHVAQSLGSHVDVILAGGRCAVGVESTILDLRAERPVLLRPGGLPVEVIAARLGFPIASPSATTTLTPTSPGQLSSHYAPRLPVRLNVTSADDNEGFLLFGPELGLRGGKIRLNLSPSGDLHEAAANLFDFLHRLDADEVAGIAISRVPTIGLGLAINDRLTRAATRT